MSDCKCFYCILSKTMQERYPDGLDETAVNDVLKGLSGLTAEILSKMDPGCSSIFVLNLLNTEFALKGGVVADFTGIAGTGVKH